MAFRLPRPPNEWSSSYMAQLIRTLELNFAKLTNPGELRVTKIVITDILDSDAGLEVGTVFNHGGVLRVAQLGIVYIGGVVVTCETGTV